MKEGTFGRLLQGILLDNRVQSITFAGMGEPLLHPELLEFIEAIRTRRDIPVGLITNGALLNDQMFKKLGNAGLSWACISVLGADKEMYEEMMPGLRFHDLINNLESIDKVDREGKTALAGSFTVFEKNRSQIPLVKELFEKYRVNDVSLIPAHSRGGYLPMLASSEISGKDKLCRCAVFWGRTFATWDGNILLCCNDLNADFVFGNANSDLEELTLQKHNFAERDEPNTICKACNDPSCYFYETMGGAQ